MAGFFQTFPDGMLWSVTIWTLGEMLSFLPISTYLKSEIWGKWKLASSHKDLEMKIQVPILSRENGSRSQTKDAIRVAKLAATMGFTNQMILM